MHPIISIAIYSVVILFVSIYAYFWYSYKYWGRKNIPYLPPRFPYGNCDKLLNEARGYSLSICELYWQIRKRDWKFAGIWTWANPVLVIVDLDYIKDILTKDFHHFIDRGMYYSKSEPASHSLFVVDETQWKNIRIHLSPTFTSGKIKMMFPLIIKSSEQMTDAMETNVTEKKDIDIREFLSKFTTDVIVSCAFGIEGNSFTDLNHPFRDIGKYIMNYTPWWQAVKFSLQNNAPNLCEFLDLSATKKDSRKFFADMIGKTVNYRKQNNITRNDFLQLLINMMEETKNSDNPFTFEQTVAQVNLFFVAGFDTSSAAMNFALYELARQPDLQEKLRNEILLTLRKHNDDLTYEAIQEMKYLQQVMDETLRIYPSVPILQRRCIKEYTLKNTNTVIEKGIHVLMPLISLHRDPHYYPDPLKFDPDRFSPENKHKINSNCYLPFGDGPRNCIGLRFGLMQTKIGLIQILKKFRLNISPSTKMPIQLDDNVFLLKTTGTLYLKAEVL